MNHLTGLHAPLTALQATPLSPYPPLSQKKGYRKHTHPPIVTLIFPGSPTTCLEPLPRGPIPGPPKPEFVGSEPRTPAPTLSPLGNGGRVEASPPPRGSIALLSCGRQREY